jgi:hypothetical protein
MDDGDVLFGLLIGLLFGVFNALEDKELPCPKYCGVDHIHFIVLIESAAQDSLSYDVALLD